MIRMFSFQSLKFDPLSIGMLLVFADIEVADIIAEQRTKTEINFHAHVKPNNQSLIFK